MKRTNGQNNHDVRNDGSPPVTRAEWERVRELLDERNDVISELRSTCRDLAQDLRRELQTQFTRIAQLQADIDALKRRS